ncbi:hypothetical protein ON010_g1688 [Phytophthora cinnamomi]|nr:hypothetical protein ON010_g1688 [Phytophthora cinnamomi]
MRVVARPSTFRRRHTKHHSRLKRSQAAAGYDSVLRPDECAQHSSRLAHAVFSRAAPDRVVRGLDAVRSDRVVFAEASATGGPPATDHPDSVGP